MPNVFSAIIHGATDSIKSPLRVGKDLIHGDFHKAFADLKHMPGNQERANRDIFASVGLRGWVGKHPTESVGAAVATVLGGWAAWGAYGAGAAGTATGAATGGSMAGAGSAMAYTPTASTVLGGTGSAGTGSALAYGGGISGSGAGWSSMAFSPSAGSAMAYAPTQSTVLGGTGSGVSSSAISPSWQNYARQLQGGNGQQQQTAIEPHHSDLLQKLMKVNLNQTQGADSGQMNIPQSTTSIIGGNNQITRNDFQNNFQG